jgi:hypothetical protein
MNLNIPYLYDPQEIDRAWAHHPELRRSLLQYARKDDRAIPRPKYFPHAKSSYREIYRVLCAQHYPHIAQLTRCLEECLAMGYSHPTLFHYSLPNFQSALSVVFFAAHLLRRGLFVENLDERRGTEKVSDLKVKWHNRAMNIEVYAPRYWEGLEDFVDELRLCLMHLDVPYDYCSKIKIDLSRQSLANGVLHFDPWDFSEPMKALPVRKKWLSSYLPRIHSALLGAPPIAEVQGEVRGKRTTSLVQVSFSEVSRSRQIMPDRLSSVYRPKTGYDPVKAFDRVLRLRVCGDKGKLSHGQFLSKDPNVAGVLVVDLNRLDFLTTEEHHAYYRQELIKVLVQTVCQTMLSIPVDAVLFVRANDRMRFPFICARDSAVTLVEDVLVGDDRSLEEFERVGDVRVIGERSPKSSSI